MTSSIDTNIRTRLTCPKSQLAKRQAMVELAKLPLPDGTKAIPLTQGKYAIVDASDYDFLMQWEWQYADGYAKRRPYKHNKPITMHGVLLPTSDGLEPDHKNGNELDNRRDNLRPATHQQNMWNRKPVTGSSSKYKGVSFHKASGVWKAYIKINEKQKHLGCFASEDDAARAYNKVAVELHGEFAKLNAVEDKSVSRLIHPTQHLWHQKMQGGNP